MADHPATDIAADVTARSKGAMLYATFKAAKAAYDQATYGAETRSESVPDAVADPLHNAMFEAERAFLHAPIDELYDLQCKLEVFRNEDGHDLKDAATIVDVLYRDVERISARLSREAAERADQGGRS